MNLQEYFATHTRAALAFSGGVDSAYLLYAGLQYGAEMLPIYVKTAFQPEFEFQDALRLCRELGVKPAVLRMNVLTDPDVRKNGPDRCYYCKLQIFSAIRKLAEAEGHSLLQDGTNASDDSSDRPGMQALTELEVQSPLRICGLTKPEIRRLSREAGLFTWDKPAYACLATRIRTGETIDEETLHRVEKAENLLMNLGYRDFRVRTSGRNALLQFAGDQLALAQKQEKSIRDELAGLFSVIELDPKERKKSL